MNGRDFIVSQRLLGIIDSSLFEYYTSPNNKETRTSLYELLTSKFKSLPINFEVIVICDESVNTPEVIEDCQLRCLVLIQDIDDSVYRVKRKLTSMGTSYYE